MCKEKFQEIEIVYAPVIPATLERMKPGRRLVSASGFAPLSSVRSAVSRLNDAAGRKVYEIEPHDNGASYYITKHAEL